MRLTKFGHACVRIEHEGTTVVLDPGIFTEPEAVQGVDAVLVTHEHADHYLPEHLRDAEAPIFTIDAVADRIRADAPDLVERVTVVTPGAEFDAGVPVRAVGELHAVIHPELPRFFNTGYVLSVGDQSVYHPGDALTGPDQDVDLLLLPVSAPWLKVSEMIDFAREVRAPRNLAIHDRIYTEPALGMAGGHLERFLDPLRMSYVRLQDGQDLT